MKAYKHLQRIKREQLAMFELPIAQLASLTANINRDSKRSPKPFTLEDFALFYERDKSEGFPVKQLWLLCHCVVNSDCLACWSVYGLN